MINQQKGGETKGLNHQVALRRRDSIPVWYFRTRRTVDDDAALRPKNSGLCVGIDIVVMA